MSTAKDKAFSTPELLEAILLQVDDMQTLLLSQRVDKTFKASINSSIHLQRALWFKPKPQDASLSRNETQRNPLIRKFKKLLGLDIVLTAPCTRVLESGQESGPEQNIKIVFLNAITKREGSWRRMLLCQPVPGPETWVLQQDFLLCKDDDPDLVRWKMKMLDGGLVATLRSYDLGEWSGAPTMGEIVGFADGLAQDRKDGCVGAEEWWMGEGDERETEPFGPMEWKDSEQAWEIEVNS